MSPVATSPITTNLPTRSQHRAIESTSDGITIFNFMSLQSLALEAENIALPEFPSESVGNYLLEATYVYTQGRYCLVDWAQVRQWHQHRESICTAAGMNDVGAQTGMNPTSSEVMIQ